MTALHLCTADDAPRLIALATQADTEAGRSRTTEKLDAAYRPLCEGTPHGAVWLLGPRVSPVGFACLSFGWSPEAGGLVGHIEQLWIRTGVRGRGMASDVLLGLGTALAGSGVSHLSAYVPAEATTLFNRTGFRSQDGGQLFVRKL